MRTDFVEAGRFFPARSLELNLTCIDVLLCRIQPANKFIELLFTTIGISQYDTLKPGVRRDWAAPTRVLGVGTQMNSTRYAKYTCVHGSLQSLYVHHLSDITQLENITTSSIPPAMPSWHL
ncbi:hypothetical protein CBL_01573 [Carabus blaptoides fortunei]